MPGFTWVNLGANSGEKTSLCRLWPLKDKARRELAVGTPCVHLLEKEQ